MKFDIITIFPHIFNAYLNESILKRAQKKNLINIGIYDLRRFSKDRHKKVDDRPYGGVPGMVLRIEPIIRAIRFITKSRKPKAKSLIVLFTPAGKQFDNKTAGRLAKNYKHLILICGRYEGIDERVKKVIKNFYCRKQFPGGSKLKIENLSVGPYVLTGGELPAMILIDTVSRQIQGVLGKEESLEEKRLGIGVPVYTRPEIFVYKNKKYQVPKILLSGNHKKIEKWRKKHRGL